MNTHYNYLFKYIIVGFPNSGKTSLLGRFLKPTQAWTDHYQPTLGLEFGSRLVSIQNSIVKIMVWDTAGQQTFRSLIRSYYKGAIVCFLVFDITNRNSMDNVAGWLKEVRANSHENIKIYLVGNKVDIENNRNVERQEAQQFVKEEGLCKYWQVSAKQNIGVEQLFLGAAKDVIYDLFERKIHLTSDMNIGIKIGMPENRENSVPLQIESKPKPQNNSCQC